MNLYAIVGAGGFGREVIPVAQLMLASQRLGFPYQIVFIDEDKKCESLNHYPVMTIDEFFALPAENYYYNIAIASSFHRKKMSAIMQAQGAKPFAIRAYNSVILDNNHIDEGAILLPFTMVTSNAKIGRFFHANIYSYVAHDCVIGDFVTFAPNVHCNGNVIIEDNAYVGTGANIKQGEPGNPIIIGEGAVIGMGAVVTKSVPAYTTVVGNPAKPLVKKVLAECVKEDA